MEGGLEAIALACSSSEAKASMAFSAVVDSRWNQRKMIETATTHHKNHVFSMKGIKELLLSLWWYRQESQYSNYWLEYISYSRWAY